MPIQEKTYPLRVTNRQGKQYRYQQRFSFPTSTLPDLARMIGVAPLLNLIRYFGGGHLYIPTASTVKKMIIRAAIHDEIQRLKDEGKSHQEIADEIVRAFKGKVEKGTLTNTIGQYYGKNSKGKALKKVQHSDLLQLVAHNKALFEDHRLI